MLDMDLRPELLPPHIDQWRINEISSEISRIGDLIRSGLRAEAEQAIATFNADTGHDYGLADFLEYNGWRSLEDFALEAGRPAWPRVESVGRTELAEIVRRIQAGDPDTDYYLLLLRANTPHPHTGNLIFHPPVELADASAEAIVDAALAYRPIAL
jgi:hypothetical protein